MSRKPSFDYKEFTEVPGDVEQQMDNPLQQPFLSEQKQTSIAATDEAHFVVRDEEAGGLWTLDHPRLKAHLLSRLGIDASDQKFGKLYTDFAAFDIGKMHISMGRMAFFVGKCIFVLAGWHFAKGKCPFLCSGWRFAMQICTFLYSGWHFASKICTCLCSG